MGKIISIATQKGGVCKTTTTGALAAGFHKKGFSVLAVDMDPQSNLSFSFEADCENSATIYHVLKREIRPQFAVQRTRTIDIIPSNILLSGIELEYTGQGREFLLQRALSSLSQRYDYIFIDTPPGLGILTANALTASTCLIMPMLADIFSLQGIAQVYETVEHVREYCNPSLFIAGILLTRFTPRTLLSREALGTAEMISQQLNIPLFSTRIRNCIALSEAQSLQKTIFQHAPRSPGAIDYMALIDEMIERGL